MNLRDYAKSKVKHKPGCLSHRIKVEIKPMRDGHKVARVECMACRAERLVDRD